MIQQNPTKTINLIIKLVPFNFLFQMNIVGSRDINKNAFHKKNQNFK